MSSPAESVSLGAAPAAHRSSAISPATSFESAGKHQVLVPAQPPPSPPTSTASAGDDNDTETSTPATNCILNFLGRLRRGDYDADGQEERAFDLAPSEWRTLSAILDLHDNSSASDSTSETCEKDKREKRQSSSGHQALRLWAVDSLCWQYDAESEKFTVRMPCAIHDTFARELEAILLKHLRNATPNSNANLALRPGRIKPAPADAEEENVAEENVAEENVIETATHEHNEEKARTMDSRQPDGAIGHLHEPYPFFVLEVGFACPASNKKCRDYIIHYGAHAVLRADITYLSPADRKAGLAKPQDVTFDLWHDQQDDAGQWRTHRHTENLHLADLQALQLPTSLLHTTAFKGCPNTFIPAEELRQALERANESQRAEDLRMSGNIATGKKRAREDDTDEDEDHREAAGYASSSVEPEDPQDRTFEAPSRGISAGRNKKSRR